jgi:hypothetical protein
MTSQPNAGWKAAFVTFYQTLATAGVWSKLDWLSLPTVDEQGWRVNARRPSVVASAVNSPTYSLGFTGNGTTSYLNSGWNASTISGLYTQNDAHMGVWIGNNVTSNTQYDIGTTVGDMNTRDTGGNYVTHAGSASVTTIAGATTSVGHTAWVRTSSTVGVVYRNASSVGAIATTSAARGNSPMLFCARNGGTGGSTTPASFSTRKVIAAHWGASLSSGDMTAFYNALSTFLTAVGAI